MSEYAFALELSAEPRFRELAADMGRRFVEVLGANEPAAAAVRQELAMAIDALSPPDGPGRLALRFTSSSDGLEVQVRCGTRATVLRHYFRTSDIQLPSL